MIGEVARPAGTAQARRNRRPAPTITYCRKPRATASFNASSQKRARTISHSVGGAGAQLRVDVGVRLHLREARRVNCARAGSSSGLAQGSWMQRQGVDAGMQRAHQRRAHRGAAGSYLFHRAPPGLALQRRPTPSCRRARRPSSRACPRNRRSRLWSSRRSSRRARRRRSRAWRADSCNSRRSLRDRPGLSVGQGVWMSGPPASRWARMAIARA